LHTELHCLVPAIQFMLEAKELTFLRPAEVLALVFPLPPEQLEALADASVYVSYPSGHVLCREGAFEHVFYIVAQGEVEISQGMEWGQVRVIGRRGVGDCFGEMALIENKPRTASVIATMPTTVLEISEEQFDDLLLTQPWVALSMIQRLAATLRASDGAAILDLSNKNAELRRAYDDLKAAQAGLVAKERLEHELEIAAAVQKSLLPDRFPEAPGYEFAGGNFPARQVGGDLYDVIRLDDEHLGLLLADVSDKSVHAALIMAVTRTLFLSQVRHSLSPSEVALAVHEGLLEVSSSNEMFVTAFYGVLHVPSGRLRYVRAGHDHPLLVRCDGSAPVRLDARGRFLGMMDGLALEEQETMLGTGDMLVIYSDGVPDAVNQAGEPYGLDRLMELVSERRQESAQGICLAIFADVAAHQGEAEPFDDVTVLIAARY